MTTRLLSVLLGACAVLLAACQSVAVTEGVSGRGVVLSIQERQRTSTASNVVGTVGGAVFPLAAK